jgi:hypothetical protein
LFCCGLAIAFSHPAPVLSETRESYLDRLRYVCAPGCLQPRDALRAARKRSSSDEGDIAALLDIRDVTHRGDRFLLHTEAQVEADYFDMQQFDFGMPQTRSRPLASVNDITVEIEASTLADLLALHSQADPGEAKAPTERGEGDILVEGERGKAAERPTLHALRALLRGRRIAVRGEAVLTPAWLGARRDHRRKRLAIALAHADDLVILPQYDANGQPILDGPLAGLAAP